MLTSSNLSESISEFNKIRDRCSLCRLLLGKRKSIYSNFNGIQEDSIAFLAYCDGSLSKLNDILEKFNVEQKATDRFKNMLKEDWLDKNDDKERLQLKKQVVSHLVELIVADYLTKNHQYIINLSAFDLKCKSDIESILGEQNNERYTEVKFLGEVSDINKLNQNAIRSGVGIAFNSISPPGKMYNYINIRIAEAVSQLEDSKIELGNRRVFIVIGSPFVKDSGLFINWLHNKEDWFEGPDWDSLVTKLTLTRAYRDRSVRDYLGAAGELIISFLKEHWDLEICKKI